jgi:hypothetical protein
MLAPPLSGVSEAQFRDAEVVTLNRIRALSYAAHDSGHVTHLNVLLLRKQMISFIIRYEVQ